MTFGPGDVVGGTLMTPGGYVVFWRRAPPIPRLKPAAQACSSITGARLSAPACQPQTRFKAAALGRRVVQASRSNLVGSSTARST